MATFTSAKMPFTRFLAFAIRPCAVYFRVGDGAGQKAQKEGRKERNQSGLRMLHGPYVCKGTGRYEYRSIRRSAREKHGVYEHLMLHP